MGYVDGVQEQTGVIVKVTGRGSGPTLLNVSYHECQVVDTLHSPPSPPYTALSIHTREVSVTVEMFCICTG